MNPLSDSAAPYQLILSRGLPDAAGAARLRQDLPDAEWHWISRLRRTEDRLRSLTGRALVRRLLGQRLGQSPARVRLGTDPHGKPMLADADAHADGGDAGAAAWHFNIAHSGDLILAGVGPGPLGVDVEHCTSPVDAALWQRVTGQAPAQPQPDPRDFCAQWVRREAVLKACGLGLRIEPAALRLGHGDPAAWTPVSGPPATGGLQVCLLPTPPDHCAALCLPGDAARTAAWSLCRVRLADWITASTPA